MAVELLRSTRRYLEQGDEYREKAIAQFEAENYRDAVSAAHDAAASYLDALLWQYHYGTPADPQVRSTMFQALFPDKDALEREYFALYRNSRVVDIALFNRQVAEHAIDTMNRIQRFIEKMLAEEHDEPR